MQAIVLAGGLGTRLRSAVPELPKPLAPVAGRPFLDHVLQWLSENGAGEVVLAVSYRWRAIQRAFGHRAHDMTLRYSVEQEPLGTGGALVQAFTELDDDHAVVVNGDTLFAVDLRAMYRAHIGAGSQLTMAVKHMEDCSRYGRVLMDDAGAVTGFAEKQAGAPGWINGGCYCVARQLFRDHSPGRVFSFEQDLLQSNVTSIQPLVCRSDAYFIDIGVPADWQRASAELAGAAVQHGS